MQKSQKIVIAFIAVIVVACFGFLYLKSQQHVSVTASPAGSTFGDQKIASVVLNMANTGANGTSTSILNTDTNSRIVTDSFAACNTVGTSLTAGSGTGLASWQLQMATSSTASPASISVNLIANLLMATSTTDSFTASSTPPFPNPVGRVWPANTYLTIFSNATNTAICTAGVRYIGS